MVFFFPKKAKYCLLPNLSKIDTSFSFVSTDCKTRFLNFTLITKMQAISCKKYLVSYIFTALMTKKINTHSNVNH